MLRGILCADDLILMRGTIERFFNDFRKWMVSESSGLKATFGKIKIMLIGGITEDVLSISKAYLPIQQPWFDSVD